MSAFYTFSISSFYFDLPTIHKVEVRLSFSPFMVEVLTVLNATLSQTMPNDYSLIKAFEIICRRLRA